MLQRRTYLGVALDAITGNLGYFSRIPAERAIGVVPTNYSYRPLNVKRYGAKGDNVTDDRAAIKTAWLVAKQQGGGNIVFPDGATYLASSLDPDSPLQFPDQNSNGSITYNSYQTQFHFQGGNNITFDFQGSTLNCGLTGGGVCMVFDGCTNICLLSPRITGKQVQSTGVVSLGAITGGSGYVPGTYVNVPLTGGTGGGVIATVVVGAGGNVTSVTPTYPGGRYVVTDVLSASNSSLGGSGSGFQVPVTSVTGAGPTVAVAAPNAVVVTSLSGDCTDITVKDLYSNEMFLGFWAIADPNSTHVIKRISLMGRTAVLNGEYGIALHNGGDDVFIENAWTYRVNRPFFFYGCQNFFANVVSEQINSGFQPVLKAYSRATRNGHIKLKQMNALGQSLVVARLSVQVQGDLAVVPVPPLVENMLIEYHDSGDIGTGGQGIEFDYFGGVGGTTLQATSANQLFNNFIIRGSSTNTLLTTVALGTGAQCQINFDNFNSPRPAAANDLNNNNGFLVSRKFTYTPVVNFGGANTGWTITATGEYYIAAGRCDVHANILTTVKGAATGACTHSLPFPMRADSAQQAIVQGLGASGMAALTSTITGSVAAGSATANLAMQGATGTTNLTDANFTVTSNLSTQVSFPI